MFKRMYAGFRKPSKILYYLNDNYWKVIRHILVMALFLSITTFFVIFFAPEKIYAEPTNIKQTLISDFNMKETAISNYKLTHLPTPNYEKQFDFYVIGTKESNAPIYIKIETEQFSFYSMGIKLSEVTYQKLNLETLDFANDYDLMMFSRQLSLFITDQSFIKIAYSLSIFLVNLIDYLFIIMIMFFLMYMQTALPMTKKQRFIVVTYLSTLYILINILGILFGFGDLSLFAMIGLVIYQSRFVSKLKIVKIEGNEDGKD